MDVVSLRLKWRRLRPGGASERSSQIVVTFFSRPLPAVPFWFSPRNPFQASYSRPLSGDYLGKIIQTEVDDCYVGLDLKEQRNNKGQ